jgi:hypothetical protein
LLFLYYKQIKEERKERVEMKKFKEIMKNIVDVNFGIFVLCLLFGWPISAVAFLLLDALHIYPLNFPIVLLLMTGGWVLILSFVVNFMWVIFGEIKLYFQKYNNKLAKI